MTRKHFQAIAATLADLRPLYPGSMGHKAWDWNLWKRCVRRMADMCCLANPRFEYERFYAACGVTESQFDVDTRRSDEREASHFD